jgi:hypothetical protein
MAGSIPRYPHGLRHRTPLFGDVDKRAHHRELESQQFDLEVAQASGRGD